MINKYGNSDRENLRGSHKLNKSLIKQRLIEDRAHETFTVSP